METVVILIFVFIVGLCLGSFYNVVILRSLSGESIVFPPSKCPKCGNKLKPWHNIPVLSFVFLKGRCAFCNEKISFQYPTVELITGILFCIIFNKFGISYTTIFALIWISCLIIMTVTDLKEKMVDCNYAIAMAIFGLVYLTVHMGLTGFINSILGAVLGFIIVELIARAGYLIKKERAMGEADSYVAMAFGAIVGYQSVAWVLIYSLLISMIVVLPMFWYNRYKNRDAMVLFLSAIFILSIAFTIYFSYAYWALALIILTGVLLAFYIIKKVKIESNLHYLPFVPALAGGFVYFLLFTNSFH